MSRVDNPWWGLCEKYVPEAKISRIRFGQVRKLLGGDWSEFAAIYGLDKEIPAMENGVRLVGPSEMVRSGKLACEFLSKHPNPPLQPGCGCHQKTFWCSSFQELVTVLPVPKRRSCKGCTRYQEQEDGV